MDLGWSLKLLDALNFYYFVDRPSLVFTQTFKGASSQSAEYALAPWFPFVGLSFFLLVFNEPSTLNELAAPTRLKLHEQTAASPR
jgi:hypothetical protein